MANPRLISIPASHYVERARFVLDHAGIAYVEDKWPPMLHLLATLSASGRDRHSCPMLVLPASSPAGRKEPRVLTDSADIVRWADAHRTPVANGTPSPSLYPTDPDELREVTELETLFAGKLGVWTRVVAYHALFKDSKLARDVLGLRQPAMPRWRRAVLWLAFPLVAAGIKRGFRVTDANAARCMERIRGVFEQVAARLEQQQPQQRQQGQDGEPQPNGRVAASSATANPSKTSASSSSSRSSSSGAGGPYLVGGRLTAADVTFAAMAAVLVLPPQYGAYMPGSGEWAPAAELRDTPAGRHVLRVYAAHRGGQRAAA